MYFMATQQIWIRWSKSWLYLFNSPNNYGARANPRCDAFSSRCYWSIMNHNVFGQLRPCNQIGSALVEQHFSVIADWPLKRTIQSIQESRRQLATKILRNLRKMCCWMCPFYDFSGLNLNTTNKFSISLETLNQGCPKCGLGAKCGPSKQLLLSLRVLGEKL